MRRTSATLSGIHVCWCCCWATSATRVPAASSIVPDVGRTSPAIRLSNVLLPLPLAPTSAVDVPRPTRIVLGASATIEP